MRMKNWILIIFVILLSGCGNKKCLEGYTEKDNRCYKEIARVSANIKYSCEDGYNLSSDETVCQKLSIENPIETKTCPNGYTLNDDVCNGTSVVSATPVYSCPSGTLQNNQCVNKVADTQALTCTKYCLTGTYDSATGKCKSIAPITGNVSYHNPLCKYSCSRGTLIGSMCYTQVITEANITYSCSAGYTLSGSNCYQKQSFTANVTTSCPEGYNLNNNQCEKTMETEKIVNYFCSEGYELENNECISYDIKEKE